MSKANVRSIEHVARGLVALGVALALVLAPLARVAHADPQGDAKARYQKGKQLFDSGNYREAIVEFAAADSMAPAPVLQFNIGLCYEKLGDKAEAARRYRGYLEAQPDAPNRPAVEEKLKKLDAEVAAEEAKKKSAAERADQLIEPPVGAAPAAPPPAAPPAATGDPELDRVAGIDVRGIRDERRRSGQVGPGERGPDDRAMGPGPAGDTDRAGPASPAGPPVEPRPLAAAPEQPPQKPVYKQWWFWVVVGVSALIVINIAASDPDDGGDRALILPPPGSGSNAGPSSGGVLFRF